MEKSVYVCGPLTDLPDSIHVEQLKRLYVGIANLAEEITGIRGFVPHEHYDPKSHAKFTPKQVYTAERKQVCKKTSCLVVVAVAPSWGGGIEVGMASENGIPIIILCQITKKLSRLLLGIPTVKDVIRYPSTDDINVSNALSFLKPALCRMFQK